MRCLKASNSFSYAKYVQGTFLRQLLTTFVSNERDDISVLYFQHLSIDVAWSPNSKFMSAMFLEAIF